MRTSSNTSRSSSGKRSIAAYKYRAIESTQKFTHFEDKPSFAEVDVLANRYLEEYATGKLDREHSELIERQARSPLFSGAREWRSGSAT